MRARRFFVLFYFGSCSRLILYAFMVLPPCRRVLHAAVYVVSKGRRDIARGCRTGMGTVRASDVPDTAGASGRNISDCKGVLSKGRIYPAVWSGHSPAERRTGCSRVRFLSTLFRVSEPHRERYSTPYIRARVCVEKERGAFLHTFHTFVSLSGEEEFTLRTFRQV